MTPTDIAKQLEQLNLRIDRPYDRDRTLADLRVMYHDSLHHARSFAIAAMVVGFGGAALLLLVLKMTGLALLLLGLAAYGVYLSFGTAQSLRQAVDLQPQTCQQASVIVVTEERISQEYPEIRSEIMWTAITRVMETDTGWLLFYGPRQAISVPANGLTDVQRSQFRDHLHARNLTVSSNATRERHGAVG